MSNYVIARTVCNMLRNNCGPSSSTIMNNHSIPTSNPLPLPFVPEKYIRSSSDSVMLRRLRAAVTPSDAQEPINEQTVKTSSCSSALAGDPKRLRHCQDIRAEILEKWNKKPKPETQKDWIKSVLYSANVV